VTQSPGSAPASPAAPSRLALRRATAYALFVFDLGQGVDLESCRRRLSSGAGQALIKGKRRAPRHFQFETPPLTISAQSPALAVGAHATVPGADVVLHDFGAVSVTYAIPFAGDVERLVELSCALADDETLLAGARRQVEQLMAAAGDAIRLPHLSELVEDYILFHVAEPDDGLTPTAACGAHAQDLARVLRAEPGALSEAEVAEALAQRISYGLDDLVLVDWNAAWILDRDCDEARAVLEFANVQLLEMRFLDQRLDRQLDRAYEYLSAGGSGWRPGALRFRTDLRPVGQMQVDGAILFERVGNALKLIGDPYMARVYRLAATRFRLGEWNAGILRKLDAMESIYQKISDRASTRRMEVLEWIIILLIALEIVLPFVQGKIGH
jgi:hypothetical protein